MHLPLAAAAALLTLLPAIDAFARADRQPPPLTLTTDLTGVVTATRGDARVRAIAAEDRGAPFVQIDDLVRGRRGWVVTGSARFDAFFYDDVALDTRDTTVSNLVIRRKIVAFDLDGAQHFQCRVRLPDDDRRPNQVRCGLAFDNDDAWEPRRPTTPTRPGRPDGPPPGHIDPPPQDVPPQWGADPDVIKACGGVFLSSSTQRCLDLVRDYAYDPTPTIRACAGVIIGEANALRCLQHAKAYRDDPSNAVRACAGTLRGNDAVMACIDAASSARVDPTPVIRSCGSATTGDANALACIRSAFRR